MVIFEKTYKYLEHPLVNGVPYKEKNFVLYGVPVKGVFPVFEGPKVTLDDTVDSIYDDIKKEYKEKLVRKGILLDGSNDDEELEIKNDPFYKLTMKLATIKLKQKGESYLRKMFNEAQVSDILAEKGEITGLVWHHYEELDGERPIMQLVDRALHKACKHTGGSYTWNKKHLTN